MLRDVNQRTTIEDMLAQARRGLHRLTPAQVQAALAQGAVVIDTRAEADRRAHGTIPGARAIPLSVLEWRLCESAPLRHPDIGLDHHVIVVCNHGYSSSLAAARLQALGFHRATDLIDGFEGWQAAGLPVVPADLPGGLERSG